MEHPDFLNPRDILQNILDVLHCPFCGCDYSEENARLKAQFEKDYVAHLTCPECQNSIIASFSYKNNRGIFEQRSPNQKMDMAMTEMVKFVAKGTISDNDVMNLYKEMGDFDGDFQRIFKIKYKK